MKLKEYLALKNRSIYSLMKDTSISKKALYDLVNNKTKGITFENLQKICDSLDCTPNDILDMDN